ncbi:MAG: DUF2125 domain-containing protein [Rhodospirillaceae bacterium]|nr:DUF2125 domain-containing protein [Rhodospirillaceae bacterium]
MRRPLFIVLAILAVVVAAWSGAWFYVAGRIQGGFETWVETQRENGTAVEYGVAAVSGYPWRWQMRIDGPVARSAAPVAWEWQGESILAELLPWRPDRIALTFPGLHRLSITRDGAILPVAGRADSPRGELRLGANGLITALELDLGGLEVALARGVDVPERIRADRAGMTVLLPPPSPDRPPHLSPSLEVVLAAEKVTFPDGSGVALGAAIGVVGVEASLMGVIPPGPGDQGLRAWRDDGGTVELKSLRLVWGKLDLAMNGTLALDGEMRPLGALTAVIRGYAETVDVLVARGLLRANQAAAAKLVFGLMARTPPEGGPPQINVPVAAQDGTLSLAGFPIAALPRLVLE